MTTTIIPTESGTYTAEYTNTCSCEWYDPETGEYYPTYQCYGDCWENTVQDFTHITEHLFTEDDQFFQVTGFPVWYGTADGAFFADSGEKLLRSITPERTEWRMKVTVHADRIVAKLWHHDAPMGGTMTITPTPDTEPF